MLILSNCLTDAADEGCLKVACSLVKRLKKSSENHYVVSYERISDISDEHLDLNKFLYSRKLRSIIRECGEKVLYLPFPAKPISSAVRIFVLSSLAKFGLEVIVTLQADPDPISRLLFKLSRAKFILLSKSSYDRFGKIVGADRVTYLKTGVDTEKFVPVSDDVKRELRRKYGLDPQRPTVLHVGHLNRGRNIGVLAELDAKYQVVLVVSATTMNERDAELRTMLSERGNIRILDEYIPNIEELYQLADVYLFPVVDYGRCIDVPLSCMEAASCNIPVVTTRYGEMSELEGCEGFYFIDSFDRESLNKKVTEAANNVGTNTRRAVLAYDWSRAVEYLNGKVKNDTKNGSY